MSQPARTVGSRTEDFAYELPQQLIAQVPAEPRDAARLLILSREDGRLSHCRFSDLDQLLTPSDLLVANRTRVLTSRVIGRRDPEGGRIEALLLHKRANGDWEALVSPARRLRPGARILFGPNNSDVKGVAPPPIMVEVGQTLAGGGRVLRVCGADPDRLLALGDLPLPPYIKGWAGDPQRYQTVYADRPGSAAAPTAGLHFTPELLARLRARGVELQYVTLHVGTDTFLPIRADEIAEHEMHAEWADVPGETLAAVTRARERGGRVIAAGTTTVRALESVSSSPEQGAGGWRGWTRLFIRPGHKFRNIDAMITNFHLPGSSLLVLVSGFADRERVLSAYRQAIKHGYRFYSFGDAMLIV